MASSSQSENLKTKNERIFKAIEKKLSLDDEKLFIDAANKVTAFLKDPRAYYKAGRPLIGNICKAARATLTRLANSGGPFYSGRPFPKELQPRVTVYTVLVETVLQHSNLFVNDHPLNEEMVEIFSSVMKTPTIGAPPSERLMQNDPISHSISLASGSSTLKIPIGKSEAKPSDIQAVTGNTTQEVSTHEKGTTAPFEFKGGSSTPVTPQQSNVMNTEPQFSTSASPFIGKGKSVESSLRSVNEQYFLHSPSELKASRSSEKAVNTTQGVEAKSSSTPIIARQSGPSTEDVKPSIPNKGVVEMTLEARQYLARTTTTPVATDQQTQGMSNSSVLAPPAYFNPPTNAELKLSKDDLPSAPTTASVPPTFQKDPISRKGETSTAKSIVKPKKKPKLGRPTAVDFKLLQEDLNWFSSKQQRISEGLASPAVAADYDLAPSSLNAPPGNIINGITQIEGVEMMQNIASKLPQSKKDYLVPVPLPNSSADTRLSEPDIGLVPAHSEALAQSPKTELLKANRLCDSSSITMKNSSRTSVFGPATIVFVSINLGPNVGESVNMDFELTPDQRELLSLWQTRDEHDRDTSNGSCLSLACYRVEDALESGFDIENRDEELVTLPLLQLTPSWPTNASISAYVGQIKISLAPPFQLIGEKLVDITQLIEGNHVQIHLDPTGDLRDYLFALIAHPPTPSQIYELEERRARVKEYQLSLENLRITYTDVFGLKLVS